MIFFPLFRNDFSLIAVQVMKHEILSTDMEKKEREKRNLNCRFGYRLNSLKLITIINFDDFYDYYDILSVLLYLLLNVK